MRQKQHRRRALPLDPRVRAGIEADRKRRARQLIADLCAECPGMTPKEARRALELNGGL